MVNRVITALLIGLLRVYKVTFSPLFTGTCRFTPSCSTYAAEAVSCHGPWRGLLFAGWRLVRCQPLTPGGYDPIPAKRSRRVES
ncbi:MAG: membrane protein insertion efficiency factor YidD [Acidobacteria bacterium]|nr:membrane protein insertion efficiency factor YidD [Acidobacteriota bacterium]